MNSLISIKQCFVQMFTDKKNREICKFDFLENRFFEIVIFFKIEKVREAIIL